MERSYDEVISDMLIQLDSIERRMTKADKRLDLSIRGLVKAESRLELVDKKLDQSIKDQKEFSKMQSQVNEYFLRFIKELECQKIKPSLNALLRREELKNSLFREARVKLN